MSHELFPVRAGRPGLDIQHQRGPCSSSRPRFCLPAPRPAVTGAGSDARHGPGKVRLGALNSASDAGLWIALAKKYFEQEGIEPRSRTSPARRRWLLHLVPVKSMLAAAHQASDLRPRCCEGSR